MAKGQTYLCNVYFVTDERGSIDRFVPTYKIFLIETKDLKVIWVDKIFSLPVSFSMNKMKSL